MHPGEGRRSYRLYMEADPMSLPAGAAALSDPGASAQQRVDGSTTPLGSTLVRAQRGEIAAFRELIRAYQGTVYSLALRLLKVPEDAEELAQDVFVSAHRHLAKLASEAHLLFWLRRAVCHRAIDRLRQRPRHAAVSLDTVEEVPLPDTSRDPLLERRVRDLVLELPAKARAVVLLKYQEDLDPSEIARVLDMSLNTVKSHLKRSLASLRTSCHELRQPISAGGSHD
jgi:RNA polymerase sigma-70 factor (ECF subfamily)